MESIGIGNAIQTIIYKKILSRIVIIKSHPVLAKAEYGTISDVWYDIY